MKLTIHRGTKEIGGSCVELNTATTKILIDFGMPLVDKKKEPFGSKILRGKSIEELKSLKILPDIKGLYKNEEKEIDAILVSHSHLDHYGLLNYVHPEIPVYLSEGAQRLIYVSNIFVPHKTVCPSGLFTLTSIVLAGPIGILAITVPTIPLFPSWTICRVVRHPGPPVW